jgi:hypothetical protein
MAKRGGNRRDPAREKSWRRTIRGQQRSGLSVRDFCRLEGLKDWTFRWWRRELARRDRQPSIGPCQLGPAHSGDPLPVVHGTPDPPGERPGGQHAPPGSGVFVVPSDVGDHGEDFLLVRGRPVDDRGVYRDGSYCENVPCTSPSLVVAPFPEMVVLEIVAEPAGSRNSPPPTPGPTGPATPAWPTVPMPTFA